MRIFGSAAPGSPIDRFLWIDATGGVPLEPQRAMPAGKPRRHATIDALRTATTSGATRACEQLRAQLAPLGASVQLERELWIDGSAVLRVELPSGASDALRAVDELVARGNVRELDRARIGAARASLASPHIPAPTGPAAEPAQWFVRACGFDNASASGLTGAGVRVAVVDSGIPSPHAELRPVLTMDRFGSPIGSDHGSFVAGVLAGSRTGLAPDVELISSRTYGASFDDHAGVDPIGRTTQRANAIAALQDALAPPDGSTGADVLVTSWGILDAPGQPAHDYDRTMAALAAAGAVVVAAAGNDGPGSGSGTLSTPGQLDDVLTVGGVRRDGTWHPSASTGPSPRTTRLKPDLSAPVVDIRSVDRTGTPIDTSSNPDGGFAGTSAAAPAAAALVALLAQALHQRGGASPTIDEVRDALPLLTQDVDAPGPDARTGWGALDASRIAEAAARILAARGH